MLNGTEYFKRHMNVIFYQENVRSSIKTSQKKQELLHPIIL